MCNLPIASTSLIRSVASENNLHCVKNALDIGYESTLFDVSQIKLDHFIESRIGATLGLPVARKARLYRKPFHCMRVILVNFTWERRTRPNHGEMASKHIQKLRKLVNGMLANKLANVSYARIVLNLEKWAIGFIPRTKLFKALIRILVHAPELKHRECPDLALASNSRHATLHINGITRTLQPNCQTKQQARHESHDHDARAEYNVEQALYRTVNMTVHKGFRYFANNGRAFVRARFHECIVRSPRLYAERSSSIYRTDARQADGLARIIMDKRMSSIFLDSSNLVIHFTCTRNDILIDRTLLLIS